MITGRWLSAAWVAAALVLISQTGFAADGAMIDATTTSGEKVRLHPNGRWEYVDAQKAAAAKVVADQYPENQLRPQAAQGCMFGIGRCIMPGDKDYNRGTLNPAKR